LFIKKKARRDEDGAVITDPRNFYTRRMRKGRGDDVLFTKPSYLCKGDLYRQRSLREGRTTVKDGYKIGGHDVDFKPAKVVHVKVPKTAYPYIPQGVTAKKSLRDAEGAVITCPPNFVTTRLKEGKVGRGTTFAGPIPYIADDYNIKHKIAIEEMKYHQSKLQEKPFSQQAKRLPWGTFNNVKETYGSDRPPRPMPPKTLKPSQSAAAVGEGGKAPEPMHDA